MTGSQQRLLFVGDTLVADDVAAAADDATVGTADRDTAAAAPLETDSATGARFEFGTASAPR